MSVSGIASSSSYNPIFLRPRPANETPMEARSLKVESLSLNDIKPVPADYLQKMLEAQFTRPTGVPDNDPSELYAVIKVGDKVVGKVYNSGGSETPNNLSGVQFGGPDEDGLIGPALAQHRAEKIAKASGGTIVKSDTAITQAQFNARPPREFFVDYEAMNAELERLRQSSYARASAYRTPDLPLPGGGTDTKA
jgi:hypothetical protein